MISRRSFLAATGGATAMTAALGGRAFFTPRRQRVTGRIIGAGAELGHRVRDGRIPAVSVRERARVAVVGGGIAGLAAAWQLRRRGIEDFVVLELEESAGGNSRSGRNEVSAFPWAAHYVPIPGPDASEVRDLFVELGIITGQDAQGRPVYREDFLCHDPQERLFLHGRWQEGLVPVLGAGAAERAEMERFTTRMAGFREGTGPDGRPWFTLPVDRCSRDPRMLDLDRQSFASWLDQEGFRAAGLRWYTDYCCRDDFGLPASRVSAWAGLHYFAARHGQASNAGPGAVVTWPAGNGWLVERLTGPLGTRLRPGCATVRVDPGPDGVGVEYFHAASGITRRLEVEQAVLAVPTFVARRLLPPVTGRPTGEVAPVYAPWVVANLTVDSLPPGRGVAPAWDNVVFGARSLGYVNAGHQSLHPVPRATVLTWYRPLDDEAPDAARRQALARRWEDWRDLVFDDLATAHPDLADRTRTLDVMVWGHGMVAPVPGYVWDARRAGAERPWPRVHRAHSDLSGLSLFEEAWTRGVRAGEAVAAELVGATTERA